MSGTLFIIGTPIGNVKDLTFRAIEIIQSLKTIACEDTRDFNRLFGDICSLNPSLRVEPNKELISLYEHNERQKVPELIARLKEGCDIGLCTSRGMPSISDPGYILIRAAIRENIPVKVVPGVSSVLTALVVSGLPPDKFLFLGFPPRTDIKQRHFFERYLDLDVTLIFFESSQRLEKTLKNLEVLFSEWNIAICREMTKPYEEIVKGLYTDVLSQIVGKSMKGEVTVVLSGKRKNVI